MTTNRLIAKFRDKCRQFAGASEGNTVITFALAFIPLVGLTGAAVDYSRANQLQTSMQAAADTTALMVAQSAAAQTASAVQSSTNSFYKALFTNPAAANLQVTGTYSNTNGSTVVVNATATYKTSFMGVVGFSSLPLAAASTASFGNSRLRVALVLDNTGSMASAGKITALKTASKNLLAQLKSAAINDGDVYVSIIPFSKDVNAGAGNYAANWIDWDDWDDDNGSDSTSTTCTQTTGKNGKKKKKCTNTTTWVPDNHNTWNGCITDRDQSYDISNTTPNPADSSLPASSASTLFPAEQYDSCPVAMMGLSYDWTALNAKIDAMSPNGNTNQGIGLAWGWQSLTPNAPLNAPSEDPKYNYQHVIILLTDGLNTENRWTMDSSQIDARQQLMCDAVKRAGITLYTIQVNTDGDPVSTLLQYCATDSGKWFVLTSSSQIVAAFNQIGTNLSKLRIAK